MGGRKVKTSPTSNWDVRLQSKLRTKNMILNVRTASCASRAPPYSTYIWHPTRRPGGWAARTTPILPYPGAIRPRTEPTNAKRQDIKLDRYTADPDRHDGRRCHHPRQRVGSPPPQGVVRGIRAQVMRPRCPRVGGGGCGVHLSGPIAHATEICLTRAPPHATRPDGVQTRALRHTLLPLPQGCR